MRVAGKFDLLDRILPKLKRKGHRYIVVFCDIQDEKETSAAKSINLKMGQREHDGKFNVK